ncbi:unnamed protein product, partial [Linum tenue]
MNRKIKMIAAKKKKKIFPTTIEKGSKHVDCFSLGPPSSVCQYCAAVMWKEESTSRSRKSGSSKFSLCCKKGKVKLPPAREPPEFLRDLLQSNSEAGKHFRDCIRMYNGVFCFSSMGGKIDHALNNGRGVYVFSIGGQIYHQIGSLLPPVGSSAKFAQLYIHQTETEAENRLQAIG